MTEPEPSDSAALIDALRASGAERFDPAGFRFIEALGRRMAAQQGHARQRLEQRLATAVAEYRQRLDRAGRDADDALAHGASRFPEAAEALRQHREARDLQAMQCLLAKLEARSGSRALTELLAQLAPQTPPAAADTPVPAARVERPPVELKSVRMFRRTWSRLRVDQQLADALAQAPEDAGPLNSHSLVLRALRLMRDISPDYLEQFAGYVEALLWLEQVSGGGPAPKSAGRGERGGKRKTGRGSA